MTAPAKSQERLDILKKIDEYEKNGWFDKDVETDPPSKVLLPDKVDYLGKKLSSKIKTFVANVVAKTYFDNKIKKKELIISNVEGIENYLAVHSGGAVLTCNHFNAYDNYAVFKPISKILGRKRLYRVIREGNFTAYTGLYAFFFKNCNTLPLSSNFSTMRNFLKAVDMLLKRGEKILIYPEEGMWWNYKKPRPTKNGAFIFAAKSNVPVLPCFITMRDSNIVNPDGFFRQEYTVHYMPAIYPNASLSQAENIKHMQEANSLAWKNVYETTYGVPLCYT